MSSLTGCQESWCGWQFCGRQEVQKVPKLQSVEGNFGEDVLDFLELLFKGVFLSCEGVEEVFGTALTFKVFSVVILLDVLYFSDFILVEILDKVFFLSV